MAEACGAVCGQTGTLEVGALRLPTADSLCSLKVARASKISGRKFSAAARRKPTGLESAEMAARRCIAAARSALPPRRAPFGRKESQPWAGVPPDAGLSPFARRPHRTPPPPRSAASFPIPSHRGVSPGWKRSQDSVFWFLLSPGVVHSSPSSGKWGRAALACTRGPCGAGGRAFRGLTRSATEWSAARRKPLRAAALPLSAAILLADKARRLPTSDRRKFPSGNFLKRARP